jgi:mono/diheme cytochrome c family protein
MQAQWREMYQGMQTMRGRGWMWGGGMMGGGMMGSGPPPSSSPLPDAKSAGAKLVSTYCVQCHAAPAPSLHTAKEWSSVTQRMHIHMDSRWQSINTPTEQEMNSIVAYMQKHARQ